MAPFEFVPLEFSLETDVSDYPKCQDQISGRLGTFPDVVNSPLCIPRVYSFQERLREGEAYLIISIVSISI